MTISRIFPLGVVTTVSCAVLSSTVTFSPLSLKVEMLRNGYLVQLKTDHPLSDVSTLVTPANWLTITVADTLLDTTAVSGYTSSLVDSTLVRRFETATQFSLRFIKPISSTEVLREQDERTILISVFFREN